MTTVRVENIRKTYGVPAETGVRVEYQPEIPGANPWQGTITTAEGAYLRIMRDGDLDVYPAPFHPTWNLTYLDPK
jgi:hypothetical protein